MIQVTLEQMLSAREDRVLRQKSLLSEFKCPVICFTMNIAGPVKHTPLIERAFDEGIKILENSLSGIKINDKIRITAPTGCEMLLSADADASFLKELCVSIEEASPLGRLFDMDVLDKNGKKLERKIERGCLVCGAPGRGCSARRLHSADELRKKTNEIICEFFRKSDKKILAGTATECLIAEVLTTPKPGLVDSNNNGSHTDMDIDMFIKSATALTPYFEHCIEYGQNNKGNPQELFFKLRSAGLSAEKIMYEVTGGVNTHKGAIYSLGVICGALGILWNAENPYPEADCIFEMCSHITKKAVESDFQNIDRSTAGGRLFIEKGLTGIRGEVSAGFPSVRNISLPVFEKALSEGYSENDAGCFALLHLIANVDDSNIYSRGGEKGSSFAKEKAKEIIESSPFPDISKVKEMDEIFIEKNLSPGGCADLLAITYFIHKLTL